MASLERPWMVLLLITSASALSLLAVNCVLRSYVATHPGGPLSYKNRAGILKMESWNYVVSVFGQAVVMPACWLAFFLNRSDDWWFKGDRDFASACFSGYVIGYYIQDCIFYRNDNDILIVLHHIGSMSLVLFAYCSVGWRGLDITAGLTFETGSLLMGLVDLGFAPRTSGPLAMAATTLLGVGFVLHGIVVSAPPDTAASAAAVSFLVGGIARLQQSYAYLEEGWRASKLAP